MGDGKGNFAAQTILKAGSFVPGDAKALIKLRGPENKFLLAASQNRGPLKLFTHHTATEKLVPLSADDKSVLITLANGQTRKEEIYSGSSFLSQSANFICVSADVKKVEIINTKGEKRVLQ